MRELFPIPRSLTGDGVRETLARPRSRGPARDRRDAVGRRRSSTGSSRASGTSAARWIDGPDGDAGRRRRRLAAPRPRLQHCRSTPSLASTSCASHVFTHPDDPDLVPVPHVVLGGAVGLLHEPQPARLARGRRLPRRHRRDARGRLAHLGRGATSRARPTRSSCSAPTSATRRSRTTTSPGVVLLWALARTLARQELAYTYRLLWSPGTLGPLCWLARNRETLDRVQHGLAISCVGDPGPLRYKRSRRGDAPIDRAAAYVLAREHGEHRHRLAARRAATSGSTARRASTCRSARSRARRTGSSPSTTPRPTTSTLVTAEALGDSFRTALAIIDVVETNGSLPQPLAVRRAAARQARPLPERSRRDEPGGSRCSGC